MHKYPKKKKEKKRKENSKNIKKIVAVGRIRNKAVWRDGKGTDSMGK